MCRPLAYVVTFRVNFVDLAARKTTKQQPTGVTGEWRDLVKNPVRKSLILLISGGPNEKCSPEGRLTIPQYGGDRITSNFLQSWQLLKPKSWKLLKPGAQVGNYYKSGAQKLEITETRGSSWKLLKIRCSSWKLLQTR